MTSDRVLELVSAAADDELNGEDHAELNRMIESSPEARKFKEQLDQMDSLLKEIPELDPPASLHSRIMAQVMPQSAQSEASILEWIRSLRPGAGLRYAIAASAGAMLVLIILDGKQLSSETADVSDVVGSMVPVSNSENLEIIDGFSLVEEGFESQIQLERSNGVLFLNVEVDAATPLDILVDMSGAGLQPDAVAQVQSNFESITVTGQTLDMRAAGEQRLTVALRRVDDAALASDARITLEFSSDGKLLKHAVLKPAW